MTKPVLIAGPALITRAIEAHGRSTQQLQKHSRALGVTGGFMESHGRNLKTLEFLSTRRVPAKLGCR